MINYQHKQNVSPPSEVINKITAMAWSPNGMRLAVAKQDKKVYLFDEDGTRKKAFSIKAHPEGTNAFFIRDIAFSGDSTRLAVAISDRAVYIYLLGETWGDEIKIKSKFLVSSPITAIHWSPLKPFDVQIGMADGKVINGLRKNSTTEVLYSTDNFIVSLTTSPNAKHLLSGHLDGSILKYNFENSQVNKLIVHSSIPYCLAWGNDIFAAGSNYKVSVYNNTGAEIQKFDYSDDEKLKEFTVAKMNPIGDAVVLGNFNKFFVFQFNSKKKAWDEACIKYNEGLNNVSSLCWKPDGSTIVTGNLCGSVDFFSASVKSKVIKEKFEVSSISASQLSIRNLENPSAKLNIKLEYSSEIKKINVFLDNFALVYTAESIVVGDIEMGKFSEINWKPTGQEKFDFSNHGVAIIFADDELALVEYGQNKLLGYCRTKFVKSNLISCRISQNPVGLPGKAKKIKLIAHLSDIYTFKIIDLETNQELCDVTHENKIDFLDLNKNGSKLVFRDRKKQLFVYDIFSNRKSTLLNYCGFVQWVPNSDVLVAQERNNVYVWYNIEDTDRVNIVAVKGTVEEIKRRKGKTELVVDEEGQLTNYLLDDGLISFSQAIDEQNISKAVDILENLDNTEETKSHWKQLAKIAISNKSFNVAARCFAASGNFSKAKFMKKIIKVAEANGIDHPLVDAHVYLFEKHFSAATNLLLDKNLINQAKDLMIEYQKWAESLEIAERFDHPNISQIKNDYYTWLVNNEEYDKAASLKEKEGDYETAINHYLKGGYAAKAAQIVRDQGHAKFSATLVESIIASLIRIGIFEKAGELCEQLGQHSRALENYREANCYDRAVAISKKHIKDKTEKLEEEWGDYLMSQKLADRAIEHYLEANNKRQAINASIQARKWDKAITLCESVNIEIASPFYVQIGEYYSKQRKYDLAEKYFVKAKEPVNAFQMYVKAGRWENAEAIIKKHMSNEDFSSTIIETAKTYAKEQKFIEAEKMYILANEPNMALEMYRNAKMYEDLIRLAKLHTPKFLEKIYFIVASELETEKNFKQAEMYYNACGKWIESVRMYKSGKMWEEAIQVARAQGSRREITQIVKEWVTEIDYETAVQKLLSLGLVESVIDLEMDKQNYSGAYELAAKHARYKLPEVHFKIAIELENQRNYIEAEEHYLKADQPGEAIVMYKNVGEFLSALRVARNYEPEKVYEIYFEQGKLLLEKKEYPKAEIAFVNARNTDFLINEYVKMGMNKAAYEFAKKHDPKRAKDLMEMDEGNKVDINELSIKEIIEKAKMYEDMGNFLDAIQLYLAVNSNHTKKTEDLQNIWLRGVDLAKRNEKTFYPQACLLGAKNLKKIGNFKDAGVLFQNLHMLEEAFDCYLSGNFTDDARALIDEVRDPAVKKKLETAYMDKTNESVSNQPDKHILDKLFEAGKYPELMDAASRTNDDIYNKYLLDVVNVYLKQENFGGACEFLQKNKILIKTLNLKLYYNLAYEMLAEEDLDKLYSLKNLLFKVISVLKNTPGFEEEKINLSKVSKIAYYQYLKFFMKRNASKYPKSLHKISAALVSYGDIIKLDLALYDGGLYSKDIGDNSTAFILWNRYLDYYSLIKDKESLDHFKEFEITDIPEKDAYFSQQGNCISEQEKVNIHEWIIKNMAKNNFQKALNKTPCPRCNKESWEFNKECIFCKLEFDLCSVSAYPLHNSSSLENCSNCGSQAITECWKEWISVNGNCPKCNSVQG